MLFFRKRLPKIFILSYVTIAIFFFIHAEVKLSIGDQEIKQDSVIQLTSIHSIKGSKLRGFAISEEKQKWYLTYTFVSENEKNMFQEQSLTRATFVLNGQVTEVPIPAHDYAFNMQTYLTSHGASGMLSVTSLEKISEPSGFLGWIANRRFQMKKHIEVHFPLSLQPEAKALLLGLRDDVDQQQTRAYQILGITHLFAISGLHVAFLTYIFYQSMLRLSIRKEVAIWCLLICLPIYAILVGGAPSVWRAVGVVEILLLSKQMNKRLSIEDAFALSILFSIFIQPGVLLQIGFQLSYAAAASLLYSSPFLKKQISVFKQSFWITFLCQIGVAPILLFHFYEISLSSFIVNLFFVPLFSVVILPINLLLFLVSFILPYLSDLIFLLYEPLRLTLTTFILKIAAIPHQLWNPGKLSNWQVVIAYLGVVSTFFVLEIQYPLKKMALTLGLPIVLIQATPYFDSSIEVTFLSVGQGDATLIELPHQKGVILIDSGGLLRFGQEAWKQTDDPFEIGREVVVPFLKGRGIHYIDKFIWTHADSDHIEGAEEILEEIRVGEIHVTPAATSESALQQAVQTAMLQKITIKEKFAGDSFQLGGTQFMYVSPQDKEYKGNDDSLVLYIKHELFTVLLTGDLEKDGEEELLNAYSGLQNVALLKGGHHGSKTSSTLPFIKKLNPKITVFSVGKNNRYGHPHVEVVNRFKENQMPTLTTADMGSIHVRYNNKEMTIRATSNKGIIKRDLSQ
ncbi:DNA internalization-related competence protein ComEC/Rec2 [Paenisporosarcina antarctica]|uniref:DNA internalization-related competence protein ComEC/Rec2 n=1 Tax=Paenisporosarcina antarctica TaxID=417367 RepID=A0A4P6ZXN1_9BACL|nr:DNA internalization-related competence protein ComEC/Rec2 [Paenisporosarcina antarctica]QBP40849.1 DNA internalization-related competence protein ComEC/Rec2 [Paenisporosarcina antarctica]